MVVQEAVWIYYCLHNTSQMIWMLWLQQPLWLRLNIKGTLCNNKKDSSIVGWQQQWKDHQEHCIVTKNKHDNNNYNSGSNYCTNNKDKDKEGNVEWNKNAQMRNKTELQCRRRYATNKRGKQAFSSFTLSKAQRPS